MDLREVREFLKDTFGYIIIAVIIFLLIVYVVAFHQVIGPSMNPTLSDGNIMLVNKLVYHFREPKRYEIIEFKHNEKIYIKRVIGLPGENIVYKDGILYVNGIETKDSFSNITADFSLSSLGTDVIPDNYYLVLGDNRSNSEDSRMIGLISRDEIVGNANLRIFPLK